MLLQITMYNHYRLQLQWLLITITMTINYNYNTIAIAIAIMTIIYLNNTYNYNYNYNYYYNYYYKYNYNNNTDNSNKWIYKYIPIKIWQQLILINKSIQYKLLLIIKDFDSIDLYSLNSWVMVIVLEYFIIIL